MAKKDARYQQSGYYPSRSGQTGSHPAKKRSIPVPLRWLMVGLCAAVFVYAAVRLTTYFTDLARVEQQNEQLRQAYHAAESAAPAAAATATPDAPGASPSATSAPTVQASATAAALTPGPNGRTRLTAYPNNPNLTVSDRIATLRKRNKDICGWLTIDGELDQAVVQRDNSYYLGRDYLGYHNEAGALFVDENCILERVPEQILIHGHNMKTGAMFGVLKKYKTSGASFYRAHPYISLSTPYEDAVYVIYAVAEVDTRPEQGRYLDFFSGVSFASDAEFSAYIARAKALAYYACPVSVLPSDRLLTLATCSGTDEDTRLLVMARMLRPDEDMIQLEADILSTR